MKIGDTFTVKKVVTEDMTAAALGSGGLPVFGTPYLVAMVENAAFTYLQQELPEGKSTVGTKVEVSHVSPSPVGMEITVTVEVTDISANGKMVDFKATATDTAGLIGEGTSAPSSPWIASWTSARPSSADFVRRNPDALFGSRLPSPQRGAQPHRAVHARVQPQQMCVLHDVQGQKVLHQPH